jgi:hypothetical protein
VPHLNRDFPIFALNLPPHPAEKAILRFLQCRMATPGNISFPNAEYICSAANFVAALFLNPIFTDGTV